MLKVFEAFSGIGSQAKTLQLLGIPHKIVATAEIDKFAIISYAAVHKNLNNTPPIQVDKEIAFETLKAKGIIKVPKSSKMLQLLYTADKLSNNLGDISKLDIESIPEHDLFTYSFPCQDISVAGKQAGLKEGSNTRSSLLWECKRVIEGKNPKYLMLENVKNLVGKKHKADFDKWLEWLDSQGYNTYWKDLNAKNYGVPQNRERVFAISIRKDVDKGTFKFPTGFDNGLRLRDFLEDDVDEKYYIEDERAKILLNDLKTKDFSNTVRVGGRGSTTRKHNWDAVAVPCITPNRINKRQNGRRFKENGDPMFTLTAQDRHGVLEAKRLGGLFDSDKSKHQAGSVWDKNHLSPTLDTMQGGYRQPLVTENRLNVVGSLKGCGMPWDKRHESICRVYDPTGISPTVTAGGGGGVEPKIIHQNNSPEIIQLNNPKHSQRRVYSKEEVSPTLCAGNKGEGKEPCKHLTDNYRIRKLTPKECWRLMGFYDDDIEKCIEAGISDSQLYKQAGNSIVVDVLIFIFKNLFRED